MAHKNILGLDLGTNSIGWALIHRDLGRREGEILGLGSRIIPMSQDVLGKFDAGQSISQTAERTNYRGVRRLYQRDNLRRERLHRVLNILGFLPKHYAEAIDFDRNLGQFKENQEPKLSYFKNLEKKFEFIFKESFEEMVLDFRKHQPQLFYIKPNGKETKIPYDWTIYYLRKKALTEKITPQELAWIILNFNQKRGYYQLRGEEEQVEENKSVKFYALKVVKVEEDEKAKNGDSWYNVHLENGWIYRRTSKTFLDWEGKIREFIVTENLDENGKVKIKKDGQEDRSFKAVNSEEDWIAIKKSTEDKIEFSGKTVGAFIYDTLLKEPNQKIRGKLIRTIERKFYKEELKEILKKQIKLQPELFSNEMYQSCIQELYPNNEAHRRSIESRDFVYLFVDDIIFYQRPLKSKKSLISKCPLEQMSFFVNENGVKKEKTEGVRCIAKTNPIYQEFRLLQWFHNLKIYRKDSKEDINITAELLPTTEDKENFFEWLNDKASISQKEILKYPPFGLEEKVRKILVQTTEAKLKKADIEAGLEEYFRWNYVQDKVYPLNETRAELLKFLKKTNISSDFLNKEMEYALWHLLYSVEDKEAISKALKKFAVKNHLSEDFVEVFEKFPRLEKNYGSFSEKAIKKLLSLMRFGKFWNFENIDENTKIRIDKILTGEVDENINNRVREKLLNFSQNNDFQYLPLWLASYVVYNKHSEASEIVQWKKPEEIKLLKQHSLRNPIVEQVINETLQTVREIWNHYGKGKENFFDEIHIELGREMKNPADKRKKMSEKISENENTNIRIKMLLKELLNDNVEDVRPYSPMQQEILKIYEEGVYNNEQDEKKLDDISKIRKKNQPTSADIKRYKLWLEQGYKSPYTGEMIPLSKLFTSDYQIEHIIPQSRYFDDSLSNKIICESVVNELKDNRLAFEFIKKNGGQKVELGTGKSVEILKQSEYEDLVKKQFAKNPAKRKKLLMEDIPEDFIQRQLNDSRYISKMVNLLLSNIVREDGEEEARAKKVIVSSGGITSRLKQDWGLNDVWNGLITPRFERLNQMVGYEKYGSWENKEGKNIFQISTIEPELMRLNKKRIDHRHHALDALIVACSTADHINYLNNESASESKKSERFDLRKKLRRIEKYIKDGEKREAAKEFYKPWDTFTQDTKNALEQIIVSFKQNNRVINKSVNYYQKWEKQADGSMKKVFVKQEKGENWAIRKPLHEQTVSGIVNLLWVELSKDEILTATRKDLISIFKTTDNIDKTKSKIKKITDTGIQKILNNYLEYKGSSELAFSPEGIEELNSNIAQFNDGVAHKPIYRVRTYEKGTGRFTLGLDGNKKSKYVQGAPNLYFAIYVDENNARSYATIPLNEVIERQKQGLPSCPEKDKKGNRLLFSLSPNDLVYVPTEEEQENLHMVDFTNLNKEQVNRVFCVNDFSGVTIYFTPNTFAKNIAPKELDTSFDSKQSKMENTPIKSVCWKLEIDRLGNIINVIGK